MHGTPSSPRSPLYKAHLFPFLCLLLQQQRPVTLLNDLTPNTSISMGLFDFFNNDPSGRDEVYNLDPNNQAHKAKLSHELIGGAAGFEAMKAYENHVARNGKPPSHALAKQMLAGFAAAEVDKLFETKGLDGWDREEAKRHAKAQAEQALDQSGHY